MTVKSVRALLGLIVIVHAVAGCASHRPWTRADQWYHEPAHDWHNDATPLDPRYVTTVAPEKIEVAQGMLADVPAKLLSTIEVSDLVGADRQAEPGMQFYLMRGVYLNEDTGSFLVIRVGTEVEVHHACLGRRAVPMKRATLIVQLREPPTEVYVTCSMDE